MIHLLDPGIGDSTFPILDVVPADDFLHAGHLFTFTASSWSMFPTIQKGDVLTIESTDRIRIGDVVVFPFMGALVCHRVKSIDAGGEIHTQGDAANRLDAPIQRQDILGKVTGIIRGHNRLVPAPAPHPSPADLMWMKIDFFQMRMREQLLGWALKSLAFLKRRTPVKLLAVFVLKRYVRFYLGVRAPLQSVQAYRFMPLLKYSRITTRMWFVVVLVVSLVAALAVHRIKNRKIIYCFLALFIIESFFISFKKIYDLPNLEFGNEMLYETISKDKSLFRVYCTTSCFNTQLLSKYNIQLLNGETPIQHLDFVNFYF